MKVSRKTVEALSNHLHKDTHKIPWVLMLGEKGSGKTTCLYYLLSSTRDKDFPDTPVNWVDINYGREWFKLIDLGQDMIQDQEMVNFFISLADGFVYVFNGESVEKLKESIEKFNKVIKKIPPNLPLLILINKRNPDFDVAINDIMDYFDLSLIASPNDPRSFHFEIVSFLTGDGVYRAFDWFVSQLLAYEGYEETITIHRVIIYDVNGLLQYDGQFSYAINTENDAVLITGLLSALNSMTRSLFDEQGFLDVVSIGDYSMVLVSKNQYICCLFIERGGAIGKAKQIAELILESFIEEPEISHIAIENIVEESKRKE